MENFFGQKIKILNNISDILFFDQNFFRCILKNFFLEKPFFGGGPYQLFSDFTETDT